jgi:molybdopterin converting factor small subunit
MYVKGDYGVAAEIYVNDSVASIDTQLKVGDVINVSPAVNGKDASKRVIDYIKGSNEIILKLNENPITLAPTAAINGKACNLTTNIKENDIVSIYEIITLRNLVQEFEIDIENKELLVNGENKSLDYVLQNNDNIEYYATLADIERNSVIQEKEFISNTFNSYNLNDEVSNVGETSFIDYSNIEQSNREFFVIVNGEKVVLKDYKAYIFVDIFSYINFDLSAPKGNIVLRLNGKSANFTDKIQRGDEIDIYWENSKL